MARKSTDKRQYHKQPGDSDASAIDPRNGMSRITDISRSSISLINYSHVFQAIHRAIIAP